MRLFIAIDCEELRDYFLAMQKDIDESLVKNDIAKIRPTNHFHMTLKFLGEIEKPDKIIDALSKVKFEKFEIKFDNIGFFSQKYMRVIWIWINPEYNSEKVIQLQKNIDSGLEGVGTKKDNRFVPHITLFRIKNVKDKRKLIDFIGNYEIETKIFEVGSIKLFKSTLTREGPEYELLHEVKAS